MKYYEMEEGEWITPQKKGYRLQCCDCGLVHKIDFRIIDNEDGTKKIQFRAFRDYRATGQVRRHMKKKGKV